MPPVLPIDVHLNHDVVLVQNPFAFRQRRCHNVAQAGRVRIRIGGAEQNGLVGIVVARREGIEGKAVVAVRLAGVESNRLLGVDARRMPGAGECAHLVDFAHAVTREILDVDGVFKLFVVVGDAACALDQRTSFLVEQIVLVRNQRRQSASRGRR